MKSTSKIPGVQPVLTENKSLLAADILSTEIQIDSESCLFLNKDENEEKAFSMRNQALDLLEQAKKIDGLIPFGVLHTHSHGFDNYVIWAKSTPNTEEAKLVLLSEFEPDREEDLEIFEFFSLEEITGVSLLNRLQNLMESKEDIESLVDDVISRGKKYGFSPDENTVRDLVIESKSLLGINLSEKNIDHACEKILLITSDQNKKARERQN